jgi:hypothetical protein
MAVLAVSACNSEQTTRSAPLETAPPEVSTPQVSTPEVPTGEPETRSDWEREIQAKKAHARKVPIGPTLETVDWEEASGFKRLAPSKLPASEREKLADIRLPVLVPDDDSLLASALVTHNGDWYAAAMETDDDVEVYIRGNRMAYEIPGMQIPEAARRAAENYTLTRTDGIVTVSWRSFGVSYSLELECPEPTRDPRCTEDAFALDVAEHLGVVGGAQ